MHFLNVVTRPGYPDLRGPTYLFNNWRAHGQQVANLARELALELDLSEGSAARVEKAARLHDIGKSKLPNCFEGLEDQPEELSRPERELLMSHTWQGYRILQSEPNLDAWVSDAALLHHEWWNGNGYPLGLARSDIPLVARIVAVADAYSTMLDQRPGSGDWSRDWSGTRHAECALAEVRSRSGTQLDPECVDALLAVTDRVQPETMPGAGLAVDASHI